MIGMTSSSAGTIIFPEPGTKANIVYDLVEGQKKNSSSAQYIYSAAQDWREVEAENTNILIEKATEEYFVGRVVSLLRMVLSDLDESLAVRVCQEVEEIFETRPFTTQNALSRLLIAPLNNTASTVLLAKLALSNGFTVTALLLDQLMELQPLLKRLVSIWLELPKSLFSNFIETRELIWATLFEQCGMVKILKAASGEEFSNHWKLFSFHFTAPQSRSGMALLAREISQKLFSYESRAKILTEAIAGSDKDKSHFTEEQWIDTAKYLEMAKKQVDSIVHAVSQGNDVNAIKFLRELVTWQKELSDSKDHVVKSLCNIAQKCADMFRLDFEEKCLKISLDIKPHDAWTLIQYGDHFKRIGRYRDALKTLSKASLYGESAVVKSSEADVYSQQGSYYQSINTYKMIPDWDNKSEVLTAIADNLRRMGKLEEATSCYRAIIDKSEQGFLGLSFDLNRPLAGMAEIAKVKGDIKEASRIYKKILANNQIDERGFIYYKLGLCNVLKVQGKFEEAYKHADDIIQKYPFSSEARFIRGSILGLIGQVLEGLEDLPEGGTSQSWREWQRHYYRGLLLFKLDRFEEAKKALVDQYSNAIASGEQKSILRMGSALWYLKENDISSAATSLSELSELHDSHAQYLSLVLKLHCAAHNEDIDRINSLKREMSRFQVVDTNLKKAVRAIERKKFDLALSLEVDSLLRLAA